MIYPIEPIIEIKNLFDSIKHTTKLSEKEAIISRNKGNQLFCFCLDFLLNPFITTGISEKKFAKEVKDAPVIKGFISLEKFLNEFKESNTGRDWDIGLAQQGVLPLPEEIKQFVADMITKSYTLGCGAKLVNKVMGFEFIPDFQVMLANKYFEHTDAVTGKEFILTEKLDGIRCLAVMYGGQSYLFSRQGQPIEGLVDIEEDLGLFWVENYVVDGELLISNREAYPSKEQYKRTTEIVRKDGEKHDVILHAFDFISYDEFINKKCITPYKERRRQLEQLFENIEFISPLPILYQGYDPVQIINHLEMQRALGHEGIMINIAEAPYEFKRTNNLLKVKAMLDADLFVSGVYEGTGKNVGKLGGIDIWFEHKGQKHQCSCGSGFSDEERILYWKQPELIVGKICTIQYFEITENADGGYGLRFPVWTGRIREDKTDISMY